MDLTMTGRIWGSRLKMILLWNVPSQGLSVRRWWVKNNTWSVSHRRRSNEGMCVCVCGGGAQEQSRDSVAYRLQVYMNRGHQRDLDVFRRGWKVLNTWSSWLTQTRTGRKSSSRVKISYSLPEPWLHRKKEFFKCKICSFYINICVFFFLLSILAYFCS